MSNRFERTADKKSVEKHQKILKDLLTLPENKICADCKKRDPRWASANLGIFICLRCSGIHRSLGVHISKVRSVDLDTWTPEHMEIMQRWGNARANKYWESALGDNHVPEEARIESFIRNKYEYKKFCMPGPMPNPESLNVGSAVPPTNASSGSVSAQAPPASFAQPLFSAPAPQQQKQQAAPSGWADFGSFASAAPVPQASFPQQQQQQQQQPQTSLKSNILNLYSQPSNSAPPQVQQQQGLGGLDFGGFVSAAPVSAPAPQFVQQNALNAAPNFSGFGQPQQGGFANNNFVNSPSTGFSSFQQGPVTGGNDFGAFNSFQAAPTQQLPQQSSFGGFQGSASAGFNSPQQMPMYTVGSGFSSSQPAMTPVMNNNFGQGFSNMSQQQALTPQQPQQTQKSDPFAGLGGFGSSTAAAASSSQKQTSNVNVWGAF